MNSQSETVECPECGASITPPEDVMRHEILLCEDCGAELEVMNVDPVNLELAPEIEEDWGE